MADFPRCPIELSERLKNRYDELAGVLWSMGTLRSLDADALVRYVLLSQEYSATVKRVVEAINSGQLADTEKWTAVQDRLHKQINTLEDRFGMTPDSRRARGLLLPEDK